MKNTLLAGLLALCVAPALAAGEDLENCRYANGISIDPRVCAALRQVAARTAAQEASADARLTTVRQRQEEQQEKQRAQEAERQAQADARAAEWREKEAARKAEMARQQAIADKREAAQEKAAAEKQAALKERCGRDYKNPTIGMSIDRAQECVARLRLTGQVNRTDGVVSIYEAGTLQAHVINGRIVAWGK